MMQETWKQVPGYPYLLVSDQGRAKQIAYINTRGHNLKERLLEQQRMPKGYCTVSVKSIHETRHYPRLVHRLVCAAFNGPPTLDKPETRHLDGVNSNNVPSNLIWGTSQDNANDRARHDTQLRGGHHPSSYLTDAQAEEIRKRCESGEVQRRIAEAFNVAYETVYQIKYRKTYR